MLNLKVGDKVIIISEHGDYARTWQTCTIDGVTPKFYKIGKSYFEKESGRAKGCDYCHLIYIVPYSVEKLTELNLEHFRRGGYAKANWSKLSNEQLLEIYKIMKVAGCMDK